MTFIEDCYNASPDSMRAALSVLKGLRNPRKIALLGDMLELGTASEEGHRNTGAWAADAGVDQLIAYGPCSAAMAEAAKRQQKCYNIYGNSCAPVTLYWQRPATPWAWSSCCRISTRNCRRGKKPKGLLRRGTYGIAQSDSPCTY